MATVEQRRQARPEEEIPAEVRRARARRAGGDCRGALKLIDEFLAARPDHAPALFEKSRILHELGDRPASLAARLKALALKKASTDAVAIADMLIEDKLFADAEALLRARLDHDDAQFTTRFTLAKLLLFTGRFLEADKEIEALIKRSKRAPLVRADYLQALRFALLGDVVSLGELVERLRKNGVAESRLTFFVALERFIAGGDPDEFAAAMARERYLARGNYLYANLFRLVEPDLFLGAGNRARQEFARVLGEKLRAPKLAGAEFEPEEKSIVADLFRRATAVRFSPIADQFAGLSGDRVLRAHTELKGFVENSCLLKIGAKFRIAIEREKMETYVANKLHPSFHPMILGYSSTRRLAGMRLSWASTDDSEPFALRRLYLDDAFDAEYLESLIAKLVTKVMRGWYVQNARLRPASVFARLERPAVQLGEILARFELAAGEPEITLPTLGQAIANPVHRIAELARRRGAKRLMIPYGLHHGDLNSRNILVDQHGHICLIDFYKSRPGFILLDAARLEADFRYEAQPVANEYLDEIRWIDTALAVGRTAEIPGIDVRRSMEKRTRVAYRLRRLMAELYSLDDDAFTLIYRVALISALVRQLGYGHLEPAMAELAIAEIGDLVAGLEQQ